MPWYQEVEIRSFVMEAPKEERIRIQAEVTAEENIGYTYYIYAVTMNGEMIDGKKELKSGSGIANQKLETEVDILRCRWRKLSVADRCSGHRY